MARVEPEPGRPADALRGVTEDVCGQVCDPSAHRALRVQMFTAMMVGPWRGCKVVRRKAAVEMNVAKHARAGEAFEGSVDRGPVNRWITIRYLLEQRVGGQMLAARRDDAGEQRDAGFGDPLASVAQQRGCLRRERVSRRTGHTTSLHRMGRQRVNRRRVSASTRYESALSARVRVEGAPRTGSGRAGS